MSRQSELLVQLRTRLLTCENSQCGARQEARAPVPFVGDFDSKIVFCGRNPGINEDINGFPFIGHGGQELDRWLEVLGLRRSLLFITNLVKCHTFKDRMPIDEEVKNCSYWLDQEFNILQPKVIVALGHLTINTLCGENVAMLQLGKLKFSYNNFVVIPMLHPGAPLYRPVLRELLSLLLGQLKQNLVDSGVV